MNKLWEKLAIATNWPVLVAVAVLTTLGVITIWADSPVDGRKQFIFVFVALACLAAFQAVDYRVIGRYSVPFYVVSLVLVLYTLIGGFAEQHHHPLPFVHNTKGAYNWINFGPMSLQPAELLKIAFVMLMARYLRFRSNFRTMKGLLAPFALALVPIAFVLKQPDLGTALIFIPALFAMLFVAGARMKHLVLIVLMGAALAPIAWWAGTDERGQPHSNLPLMRYLPELVKNYQRARVYAMFDSDERTLAGTGFQQQHALIAYGSGGISGKGIGKLTVGRHVPEGHNDMIFALIGEQLGFFGSTIVFGAYLILFTAGIEIAAATREPFGKLVAVGVVSLLAGQTFLNLLVAVKLMPVTGVTLPFISYGGSSLVASFMAAGLLLNIGQNRPLVMANDAFEFA
ncbi:rod shape-determining protein RodA [soil metagenome]